MMRGVGGVAGLVMVAAVGCSSPAATVHSVSGTVELRDELGSSLSGRDSVTVTLTRSDGSEFSTSTTPDGAFSLEVPASDPVTLRFERDGFGTTYAFDVLPDMGRVTTTLVARSTAEVTNLSAVAEPCGASACLTLNMDVSRFFAGTTRRLFRIFFSTSPEVSARNYEWTSILVVPNDLPGLSPQGSAASFELTALTGLLHAYLPGTTVYMVVHGATENLSSSYQDPSSGLEVFTDLAEPSAASSVTIP